MNVLTRDLQDKTIEGFILMKKKFIKKRVFFSYLLQYPILIKVQSDNFNYEKWNNCKNGTFVLDVDQLQDTIQISFFKYLLFYHDLKILNYDLLQDTLIDQIGNIKIVEHIDTPQSISNTPSHTTNTITPTLGLVRDSNSNNNSTNTKHPLPLPSLCSFSKCLNSQIYIYDKSLSKEILVSAFCNSNQGDLFIDLAHLSVLQSIVFRNCESLLIRNLYLFPSINEKELEIQFNDLEKEIAHTLKKLLCIKAQITYIKDNYIVHKNNNIKKK
ncbi:hypothetical protein CYY_004801 [Polysphondylium violaceum]|uniref:Uncharacterized protein n=1 Tax=Polysphondylium violaceum TaxID=133409 RepID=A0A8J4V4T2_9MYCE|nr:hypothetical protein CYY_004801 [Polysphondylium violaceum]